jgi:hypothetical protein
MKAYPVVLLCHQGMVLFRVKLDQRDNAGLTVEETHAEPECFQLVRQGSRKMTRRGVQLGPLGIIPVVAN